MRETSPNFDATEVAVRTIPVAKAFALSLLGLGFFFGCSGDSTPTGGGGGNPAISISLSATTLTLEQAPSGLAVSAQSNQQLESGSSTVTLSRTGGFTGAVSLTVEGAPSGVSATAAPSPIGAGSSTSLLSISAGATATPGSYTLTVRATGSGVSAATATLALTVTARPIPTFSLATAPGTLTLPQGADGTSTVTITRGGGFTGEVTFGVTGMPAGMTATTAPAATAGTTSTVTVTVGSGVAPGTYPLTITGTATGLTAQTADVSVTVTEAVTGSYTLTMDPATLPIQQGANATSALTITRGGGFTDDVALAVSGMPGGMTATANPASTGGNTSTVSVTVGAGVAVGSYPLVVTGSTGSLPDQTVGLSVAVTMGGGGGGNVTFAFCDESELPIWVAYQDGNGAWTQAAAFNHSYSFDISSAKGGVAFVTDDGMGQATTLVYLGTATELSTIGGNLCDTAPGTSKTINGSVAGLGLTDQATVSLGGSSTFVPGSGTGSFSLPTVSEGPRDLIAASLETTAGGLRTTVKDIIIRRGLNPVDGATLPVLDFGSAEAFTPEMRNLTITNLGTRFATLVMSYFTANGGSGSHLNTLQSSVHFPSMIPTIGGANQAVGDLHFLSISVIDPFTGVDSRRFYSTFFSASTDKTVTLGPHFDPVTLSTATAAPYVRLRAQNTVQAEYDSMWTLTFSQAGGASVALIVTGGHQGGDPTLDYTIPDFTSAAGWKNAWGLTAGTEVSWVVAGMGWDQPGGILGSPLMDGAFSLGGSRFGTITP